MGASQGEAAYGPNPNINYDVPNFANSPLPKINPDGTVSGGLRKFVDSLPGLNASASNNLGQYIPVAAPDQNTYPGCDYYEIDLVEYFEQMHSDLPPTRLRGYAQVNTTDPTLNKPHYLGPLILAQQGRPTRIKFTNRLPVGSAGDLFIPVDTTLMGAGDGPIAMTNADGTIMTNANGTPMMHKYTDNRSVVHLHGGLPPWISDGTPHQWVVPAGENTPYQRGVSAVNVPDMPIPGEGAVTLYYPNDQSGRLLFYHDHAPGLTRLNVYAGMAAGYLLMDPTERALTEGMPELPLIIQDKSWVPDSEQLAASDPLWDTNKWGGYGSLWFPHVYMPNQDPTSPDGSNPIGRWDYGPWFWPVFPVSGELPTLSSVPESFLDTPVVNGTAYPYYDVQPTTYRLRVLNAANDRYFNLQLYQAEPLSIGLTASGSGYTDPVVTITDPTGTGAAALAVVDTYGNIAGVPGSIAGITITSYGSNYTAPTITITDNGGTGSGATAIATLRTEVRMVDAFPPQWKWPAGFGVPDAREGGWADPAYAGPAMVQIGTECGLLPMPAVLNNVPIDFDYDRRSVTVLNVLEHTLFLGPAERADIIVDFSQYAGKTVILYNDAPAPVPASDTRVDYYTGNPDQTAGGGTPSTLPGFGPNTRTIMQFRVAPITGAPTPPAIAKRNCYPTNLFNTLTNTLPAAFLTSQDVPVVPEAAFNPVYASTYGSRPNVYSRIGDNSLTFIPYGSSTPITMPLIPKCIQELFDPLGRMNSTLGTELPFTTALIQTTIPLGYIDPATEKLDDGEMQLWKITHNGVDTHAVHFHLVNVQIINRVGWDNAIKPPEPNEVGWKETIRMNPLEDIIVAVKAKTPTFPFKIPDSIRPLNPAMPLGSTEGFTQVDPVTGGPPVDANGNRITITNQLVNFGWEYVWHCHLLGHEENDMMRPIIYRVSPDAPTNLTASLATTNPTSVALTWQNTASTPAATSNLVQRALDADFTTGVTEIWVDAAASTYTDNSNLAAETTYYYRVRAENDVAYSAWTSTASVTTPPPTPSAPIDLTGNLTGPPRVLNLSWTPGSTNATTFRIQRAAGNNQFQTIANIAASLTNYVDSTTDANQTYRYRVYAINASGTSPASSILMITTPSNPLAPSNLSATSPAGNTVSVVLTWRDNANNEAGFQITRALDAAFTLEATTITVSTNVTTYTDTGVSPLTSYFYRVRAFNATAYSLYANTSVVTPDVPPGAPSGLTATATSAYNVDLAWTDGSTNELGFAIQRALDAGFTTGLVTFNVSSNVLAYSDTTVGPATTYYYRVQATNTAGASTFATATATTPDIPPAAPLGLTATAISAYQVNLAWTDGSTNELGFVIQRAADAAFTIALTTFDVAANVTTLSDTNVGPLTTYYYRVQATNAVGGSTFADATITTPDIPPAAPSGLTATAISSNKVDLLWIDGSTNELGFVIRRATDAGFTLNLTTIPVSSNVIFFSDTSVQANTRYYYQVSATNTAGNSAWSTSFVTFTAIPAAPTTIAPLGGGISNTPVFTFNAVAGATGYQIYLWTNAASAGGVSVWYTPAQVGAPSGSGTATITLPSALPDGTFIWQIRARNAAGVGAWSAYANFAAGPPPAAPTPSAPIGGGASATPAFTFNAVAGATGYQIYLWTNATSAGGTTVWYTPAQVGAPSGSGTATITLPSALPVGTYIWQVRAKNSSAVGAWSGYANFGVSTPPAAPTPSAPIGGGASATPAFTFNAVAGATGYQIYLWTNAASAGGTTVWYTPAQVGAPSGSGTATITLPSALPDGTYIWQVRAMNSSGVGAWSGYANFGVGALPAAPTPSAPIGGGASATPAFTFNAVAGATGYQIYLWSNATGSGSNTAWYTPAQVGAPSGTGTATITLPSALASGSYTWQVHAKNLSGVGAWSGYASFSIP